MTSSEPALDDAHTFCTDPTCMICNADEAVPLECHECGQPATDTVRVDAETAGTCAAHRAIVRRTMHLQLGLEVGPMMVLAEMITRNHTFRTASTGTHGARVLMHAAWNRHVEQTGATGRWADVAQDITYTYVISGMVQRDGEDL